MNSRFLLACVLVLMLIGCGGSSMGEPTAIVSRPAGLLTPVPHISNRNVQTPARTATYVVHPGDSLSLIATQFRVSEQELQAVNHLDDPESVYSGQKLVIPKATE